MPAKCQHPAHSSDSNAGYCIQFSKMLAGKKINSTKEVISTAAERPEIV